MYLKNCWYCAGWEHEITQGKDSLIARRMADEPLLLYRTPTGKIVAMEDRCCHRQAPLSLGLKEGDSIRCGYHGMKFGPDGRCVEIPGQPIIPSTARVRTFPVVVKNSWVWVWMGDPAAVDPDLICFAVGPDDPNWNIKTSKLSVNANYLLEIANLMDLSHATWIHRDTLGGTRKWADASPTHTIVNRGVNTTYWLKDIRPPAFTQHLFPEGATFDIHANIEMTLPCNFVMRFQVWSLGTAESGTENGELLVDSYTCQAVTPRDADWVDYYYSWGMSNATDVPGMSEMLLEGVNAAFLEDKTVLEAQHQRIKERPDGNLVDIKHDEGPNKLLWVLNKLLTEEAQAVVTS